MTDRTFPLGDNLRFLRALARRPQNIGAVLPSSAALARAIAAQVKQAIERKSAA